MCEKYSSQWHTPKVKKWLKLNVIKCKTKKNCVLNFKYRSAYQGISLVIEENINSEWLLIL